MRMKFGFFLLGLGFIILLQGNFVIDVDGLSRYESAVGFFEGKGIDSSKYSIIGPFFSFPLWLIAKFFNQDPKECMKYYNIILLVLSLFTLYVFQVKKENWSNRFFLNFSLLIVTGSMFTKHIHEFYGEVFSSLLMFLAIIFLIKDCFIVGGILGSLSVANTPPTLIGFSALCLLISFEKKQFRYLLIPILSVTIILFEMYIRRNFQTGYQNDFGNKTILPYSGIPGFSYPIVFGILSIFLSFGKGLIFFTPGIFLPYKKNKDTNRNHLKNLQIFLSSRIFVLGLVIVYAGWWSWYGGWFWGPRFFLFCSILSSFLIALHLPERGKSVVGRLILMIAVLISLWVGFSGIFHGLENANVCKEGNYKLEFLCWYVPEFSPIFRPFVISFDLIDEEGKIFFWFVVALYLLWDQLNFLIRDLYVLFRKQRSKFQIGSWKF